MAGNGNNNPRPEDNPFIAFRRFADSQVSSILNTVFTLPATIANFNSAHQAREQCLFGKADTRQCDKLREIEAETTELQKEGRELFQAGDIRAVLKNSEELVRLDRRADDLRRDILGTAVSRERGNTGVQSNTDLVERVANEKGQEWGGSWDWGFPKPFDHESQNSGVARDNEVAQRQLESMRDLQSEARKLFNEESYDDAMASLMKLWNNAMDEVSSHPTNQESRADAVEPRVWSWSRSWQWPPPADSSQAAYSPRVLEEDPEMKKAGVPWRKAYEDLLRAEHHESPHCMRSDQQGHRGRRGRFCNRDRRRLADPEPENVPKWVIQEAFDENDEPSYEYAHDHEDQHDEPPSPKVDQGSLFPNFNISREEQNKMAHADHQRQQHFEQLDRQEERGRNFSGLPERDAQEHSRVWQSEQLETQTELDVYEQLLATKEQYSNLQAHVNNGTAKPSILSTLTTTERSVAPDGSVTTKVVLKKRFADGREESSETVHTQNGREDDARSKEPWKVSQDAHALSTENASTKESGKRSGWFWSS